MKMKNNNNKILIRIYLNERREILLSQPKVVRIEALANGIPTTLGVLEGPVTTIKLV